MREKREAARRAAETRRQEAAERPAKEARPAADEERRNAVQTQARAAALEVVGRDITEPFPEVAGGDWLRAAPGGGLRRFVRRRLSILQ